MAKSSKPSKKSAAKKSASKAALKKATKKKVAKKKAAPEKAEPVEVVEEVLVVAMRETPLTGTCFCMERDGLFFCMKKMPNGSFKECPTLAAFETLEECQQHSCV